MGLFHVYVEAPDRLPATITKLATTIGKKYGVPVAELEKRLAAGRFRVKANVDRATADVYAKALADSGAIVKIEDAVPTQPVPVVRPATPSSGAPVVGADPDVGSGPAGRTPALMIPRPAGATAAPALATPGITGNVRPNSSSLPPATSPRPASSSLPPKSVLPPAEGGPRPAPSSLPPANRTSTPPAGVRSAPSSSLPPATAKSGPVVASGLSAAYTESAKTDLGALGTDSLSLASLDGNDADSDGMIAPVDLSPEVTKTPAPAATPAAAAKAPKPKDEPMDMFAPPDSAEDAAFQVELAPDEIEHRARKMSTPPAGVPVAQNVATPQLQQVKKRAATPASGHPVTVSADAMETPRWRFAAGVMVSIILGFIPAHLIAASRESSAFAAIDAAVVEMQSQADTPELYEELDKFREAELAHKQSKQRSIAITSMLIWAVTGGGLAYVWFRRVPWDKLGNRPA